MKNPHTNQFRSESVEFRNVAAQREYGTLPPNQESTKRGQLGKFPSMSSLLTRRHVLGSVEEYEKAKARKNVMESEKESVETISFRPSTTA